MKVFIFSDLWQPFPGGAERYIANIARQLQMRGHEISALTSYEPAKDTLIDVTYKSIGVKDRHAEGVEVLKDELWRVKPHVIVTHHFFAYEFEAELIGSGIPVVQLIYNNYRIPGIAFAVFISRHVWRTSGGLREDLLIHPPAFEDIVAATHGEKIGFIKPIHHKGVDTVYRLAEYFPQFQFVILRGEWQAAEDIRFFPNVEFMEPVADMREFYQQCKIILMPSWNEDAGTVAQEAAMNGLPCISTTVMGLAETNAGGIQLERNELYWREQIELLMSNPSYYQQIATRQKNYLHSFQWERKFTLLSDKIKGLV